jgi:hypothetical protein
MFSLAIHLIRIPKKWLRRLWLRSITLMVATLRCMFVATLPGATSASASRFDQRRSWSRTESRHRRRICPVRAAGAAGSAEPLRGLPPRLPPLLALRVYFLHGKASGRRQRAQRRSDAVACSNIHLEGPTGSPKLFLAPAKGGGAPPDACRVDGASAPLAASPSMLAGGRRMGAGKGGRREGRLH